ncbi:ATP synthase subunit I [Deltaproteobacteria bacterium]|nr:ATP synthase subunit I [Deltaproteobacteria bacterium]
MEETRNIQKKYCSQAMIVAIAAAVVLILLGEKSIGKGLVLGTLFSVINFLVMGRFLIARLAESQSRKKASAFALMSILLRFAILAIPLVVSLKVDAVNFIAVVIGVFMVQLIIISNHLILNRFPSVRKV